MNKQQLQPVNKQAASENTLSPGGNNRGFFIAVIGLGVLLLALIGVGQFGRQTPTLKALPSTVAPGQTTATVTAPPADAPIKRIDALGQLPPGKADQVELVYFHRTQRCHSCMEAERLTRKTLDTYFSAQLDSGAVRLVSVDVQAPQNALLVHKYGPTGSSLFFGILKGGVEYLCPVNDIWLALNDEARFLPLLQARIDAALGAN